jgi:hypothetical protein
VVTAASEPASYTWNFSAGNDAAGGIADHSGANTAAPIDISGGKPMPRRPDTLQRNIVARGPAKKSVRTVWRSEAVSPNGWLTAGSAFVLWESDIIRPFV